MEGRYGSLRESLLSHESLKTTQNTTQNTKQNTTQDTTQDTKQDTTQGHQATHPKKTRDKLIYDIYRMTLESHWRQTWMYRLFGFPRSQGWSRQYYKIVYQHYHDLVE